MNRSALSFLFVAGAAVLGGACQLSPEVAAFQEAATPLTAAIGSAEAHVEGTALEASFEREAGMSVFSVVVVDAQDAFWEVYIDSRPGEALSAQADPDERDRLPPGPVTLQQAIEAAEAHQGGSAMDAEFDDFRFQDAFSVTVVRGDRVFDLYVAADDARILQSREDRDERRESRLD